MTTSKTIAALLGPTLLASAVMLFVNMNAMPALIGDMSKTPMLIVIAGYAAFVPGLAIVYFHNRWSFGWPLLITIMGWLSVVVGLIRMIFPLQLAEFITASPGVSSVAPAFGLIFLLIGGVLTVKAYRQ
jgi:hypothetical protein